MSVVIVANGPIEGLGEEIDSHDIVIRMHHADISALESDVGSKMNIWVSPLGFIRDWMDIPDNIKDCQHIWTFSQERGESGPNHDLRQKFGNKIYHPGREFIREVYDAFSPGFHPTKGFLTLQMALRFFEVRPIHVVGYSFYETNQAWFWDKSDREAPKVYDIGCEKDMINWLIEDGMVKKIEKISDEYAQDR